MTVRSWQAFVLLPLALLTGLALAVVGQTMAMFALVGICGLAVLAVVISRGPLWCLAALVFLGVLGWTPTILAVGLINLTPLDVIYGALLLSLGLTYARRRAAGDDLASGANIGQAAIWVFVLLLALGALGVYRREPAAAGRSFLAWVRLAQTVTLISLIPMVVRTRRQLGAMLWVVAVAGMLSVVLAMAGLSDADSLTQGVERAGTFLSANSVGLLSAVLLVLALHSPVPTSPWGRLLVVVIALLGLITSRSIGSFIAAGVVLTISGLSSSTARREARIREHTFLPAALRLLAVAVVIIDFTLVLRPESVPGRGEFGFSSTMHRVIVGSAGLEIFQRHPVMGVGWQQSSEPEFIGDPEINRELRRRFPQAHPELFPDITPTSVHNFYIQTLAEAGIIGFFVLAVALGVGVRRVRAVVARARVDEETYRQARFLALSLFLVLIWLNENPLFGGLPTNLIAIFLGLVAAVPGTLGSGSTDVQEAPIPALPEKGGVVA